MFEERYTLSKARGTSRYVVTREIETPSGVLTEPFGYVVRRDRVWDGLDRLGIHTLVSGVATREGCVRLLSRVAGGGRSCGPHNVVPTAGAALAGEGR